MDACWRAANYLTVGQIYPQDNPLLEMPLKLSNVGFDSQSLGNLGGLQRRVRQDDRKFIAPIAGRDVVSSDDFLDGSRDQTPDRRTHHASSIC